MLGPALGASIDADVPSAAESVAVGLLDDLPDGSSPAPSPTVTYPDAGRL
jgi:hypothetical protein